MAPRETENNAYAKFGVTNKEHYGMLWYFLEWSIMIWYTVLSLEDLQLRPKYITFSSDVSMRPAITDTS